MVEYQSVAVVISRFGQNLFMPTRSKILQMQLSTNSSIFRNMAHLKNVTDLHAKPQSDAAYTEQY